MIDWGRIEELFAETNELAPDERRRVLAEVRETEPEIAARVESLILADERGATHFETNAVELLLAMKSEPPAEELCGTDIGSYHIDEHLSTGGMGHVYGATRTSAGTERRVAFKVLRPSLDTEALLNRFHIERESLARLEHESIVSFLDAGSLPDGRPFLVMEYVEGVPIGEWCEGRGERERVELFLRILDAVHYAHGRLVVHCDLKPANVLVTPTGTPKLLDFGVAALLERSEAQADELVPLTPGYASPEQRRGEAASTANDVYSLGVMLSELLRAGGPGASRDRASLPRDLELIVRTAQAEDLGDRYDSALAFAEELRRYLACEAISQRRGERLYVARQFVRRQRAAVTFLAAVIAALALGWLAADLARRDARTEAGMGWGAHAQAKMVSRVLEDWMATVVAKDPELQADAIAHLEEVLSRDMDELPEARVLLGITIGELYLERGEKELAWRHASTAAELAQSTRGVGRRDRERAEDLLERARSGD